MSYEGGFGTYYGGDGGGGAGRITIYYESYNNSNGALGPDGYLNPGVSRVGPFPYFVYTGD